VIRVAVPQPPAHYVGRVKNRGAAFLATNPAPTNAEWRKHRYWSEVHKDLHKSLGGICSYCATFTPRRPTSSGVDHTSIDHFVPKIANPALAYEWTNFRLCRARLNNRKDHYRDVVDPYAVVNGHFRLDFTTFLIFPDAALGMQQRAAVSQSLARLGLNTDDAYVNERARAVYSYVERRLTVAQIATFYPFIALELKVQDFDNVFLPIYQRAVANPKVRAALVAQGVIDP
jgi:hypothetical protein